MKMSTEVLESVINESIEQVIAEQKETIDDETVDLTPVGEFDPDKEQDFANDKNDEISDEAKIDGDSTDSTEEKVEEMVENKVEEYPDMTFLGLDITISKKEDSDTYVVKVSDLDSDVSEEFDLESVNLQGILGIVEDFFNKLQLNSESLDEDISDKEVLDYIEKILDYYTGKGIEKRLGRFIDQIGFDKFSKEVLGE